MGYEWLKSKYKDIVDGNFYWKIMRAIDKSPMFEFSKLKNEWEEFHNFPINKNSYFGNYTFDEKDLLIERGEYFIEICEEMIKSYDKFVKKYDITSESWGYEDDLIVIKVLKDCISASEDFIKNLKKIKSPNEWTESKKSARKSMKESVDKTFFDFMCDKDFFKGISKQVTKKEKCQFDFYKTPNSYTWLITYKKDESLQIYMDERTNDIFIHVNKNGKSGKDFKFPQLTFNDSVDELLDIIIRYVQGNFDSSWYESKKFARKSMKESMNLDYGDFDYKKFENWIIRYLEDYGCEVNTVEIICDDYGYDVEINVENGENLPSRISDKDYGAFIFDAMYTTNCLYLKMPIVRAMKIAEEFSPKVLKVNDDSILIGDKNSDTEIWLDVWTDNDGDEDYTEWDYNQQSFNLNNYEDMVQKYLQQIDDFFYILDGVVSDNF